MTDDFVTRLGVALRDAADREERRRVPWRALATARTTLPRLRPSPVLATLIAGLVLAAAVYGLASLRTSDTAPAGPKIVAKLSPAGGLDQIVAGFGSVWLEDSDSQTLLRMDPATRRVTARIPLGGAIEMAPGRGVLWVGLWRNGTTSLLRIDPKTNKVAGSLDPGGARRVGPRRAGDGQRPTLGPERRGGHAGRPARPAARPSRIVTARNGYRTRSLAVVRAGTRNGERQQRRHRLSGRRPGRSCARRATAAGTIPPCRRPSPARARTARR